MYVLVDSKTRTYHGRIGTGVRTAGRRDAHGDGSPRRKPPFLHSRRWKMISWAFLWKHE